MRKIIFITGNKGKLNEAREILKSIEIINKEIDLPEIQEIDARKVIGAKLLEARKRHRGEYMVEDTSLYLDCLNGLPGPLIKWFLEKIQDKGIFEITKRFKNKKSTAKTFIGYINRRGKVYFFEGTTRGNIVAPRGEWGFGWDKIFLPNGREKTFGQMSPEEKNKISMRKMALKKLERHLKIYKNK